MQSGQFQPHDPFGADPFAPWQPPARRGNSTRVLIILGAIVLALIMCCVVGIMWFLDRYTVSTPSAPNETVQERIDATIAAYASNEMGVDGETLLSIQRLLGRISEAATEEDDEAFAELVDFNRLMEYITQSPHYMRADVVDEIIYRMQLQGFAQVDPSWQRITLRHVDPVPGTSQYILYTHCYDEVDDQLDFRFWLTGEGGSWKVADWQRLDLGTRVSTELALFITYAEDPRLDEYFAALEDIGLAYSHAPLEQERVEELLRRAESRRVLPEFRDQIWVQLGYQWNGLGESSEALRCFDMVRDPRATPGVYFGRALCFGDQSEYAQAIEAITQYQAVIGDVPDACRYKAYWLAALGRDAEQVEEWKNVLRAEPQDQQALRSFAELLDDSEMELLGEYLDRSGESLQLVESLAESLPRARKFLRQYADKMSSSSATRAYLTGLELYEEDRLEEAAGKFLVALENSPNEEAVSRYQRHYLETMIQLNRVVEGYEARSSPQAFRMLMDEFAHDSEIALTEDEIGALVAAHRKQHPTDPLGTYHAATRLSQKGQYAEAAEMLKPLLRADDLEEWIRYEIQSSLEEAMIASGEALNAVALAERESPGGGFAAIAQRCQARRRWEDLRALVNQHEALYQDDGETLRFRAVLAVQNSEYARAEELLKELTEESDADADSLPGDPGVWGHPELWEATYEHFAAAGQIESLASYLAAHFDMQKRYGDLRSLLEKHHARFPNDLTMAEYHWNLVETPEEAAKYIDAWLPFADELLDEEYRRWRSDPVENLVRALLINGRAEDALALATRARDEHVHDQSSDLVPIILCQAEAGRVDKVCELVDLYVDGDGSVYALYEDALVGHLLRAADFAQLHEAHPWGLPASVGVGEIVLLYDQAPDWDAERLESLLQGLGESVTVTRLPAEGAGQRLAVALDDERILVSVLPNFLATAHDADQPVLEKQQRELVDQSCTWISVVGVRWGDQDNIRQCRSKVRDTAVRLLEDNCLAVWLTNQSRLLSNRPDSRQTLAAATTLEEFSRLGEFTEITAESEQQDVPGRRALGRAMRRLVYTFPARTEGDQYHVAADVQIGSSAERLWMSLERIEDESRFVGTLVEDSLLLPDMSAGRRLLFEEYEVTGCRFRHHEQQVDATIALGK